MANIPALDDGVSDPDRVEHALAASRTYFAARDTADAARGLAEGEPQYSPLRALCQLGEEAFARIRAQIEAPPCIPSAGELNGGDGGN